MKYRPLLALSLSVLSCISLFGQDFEQRRKDVGDEKYFEIFASSSLDSLTRKTLEGLYAGMPLVDLVSYSGEYFLAQVRSSLKARELVGWGHQVPEREFQHFVVPIRVNNEPLDEHRELFLEELLPRVKGLSAKEAILEVNHWCHEKASYQPSDSRTHSPLATVSSAIGRCGEESTFTVAALRSICIPARQVYTPRWAHTDDNHAWVEAWADGQWWFLGACEPEPVLNLGWFNEPASRGMLMNTSVFGSYDGPEEPLSQKDGVTTINVTENYAPVDTLWVKVVGRHGRPLKGMKVSFRLYNYAEYYSLATFDTDAHGQASIVAGLGDLLVWVSDGRDFCFRKASVGKDKLVEIVWTKKSPLGDFDFDLVPPKAKPFKSVVSKENEARKAHEDSLRAAYIATNFYDGDLEILASARGNWRIVEHFLQEHPSGGLELLESLSPKDLTDVSEAVLEDAIAEPMICPRVSNEELSPFRQYFCSKYSKEQAEAFAANPRLWEKEVLRDIDISQSWHPASFHMTPSVVGEYKRTDRASRDIYFVAGARSFGITARIDPVTGKVQWRDSVWRDAFKADEKPSRKGEILLTRTNGPAKPIYYSHFSLSKIENGFPRQMEFEEGTTLESIAHEFDEGSYMLTTGQRLSDGSVLAHNTIFTLKAGETKVLPLVFRNDPSKLSVIGNLDAETPYYDFALGGEKSILSSVGRGFYALGIVRSHHEPSIHAIKEIEAAGDWGGKLLLLSEGTLGAGRDIEGNIQRQILQSLGCDDCELPIFVIADSFNRIVYFSNGYTIGLGARLKELLERL